MPLDVDKFGGYFRNRHDEQAQKDQRRRRENANSEVCHEFLHSYLIIALVASNYYFFNRFAAKVRRLLLTRALLRLLLCTLIPRREISVSLSFRLLFWSPFRPSPRLILSRVYLIALTKRELSPNVVRSTFLADLGLSGAPFSATRCSKFPRPPVCLPDRTAKDYLASPPRFFSTLAASRFFLRLLDLSASQTLFRDFFATYLTCHSPSDTLRDRDNYTRSFFRPSMANFGFGFSARKQEAILFVVYTSPIHSTQLPRDLKIFCCRPSLLDAWQLPRLKAQDSTMAFRLSLLSRAIESLDSTLLVLALMISIIKSMPGEKTLQQPWTSFPISCRCTKGERTNICLPPFHSTYD